MADVNAIIAANRAAVDDLLKAAERAQPHWTTPSAPGKWSPQQIVEHVAMAIEEGGNVIAGRPTRLPSLPFFVRPVARLFLRRVVKTGRFPKAKTNKAMDPAQSSLVGPANAEEARRRLNAALDKFEEAVRSRAAAGDMVQSSAFGKVSLEEYARFNELHTFHHLKQIPQA